MTKSPLHDVSPRPLFAAWFENLAVAEEHPDRVYFVVEATLRNAQMSAHHEVEESGPEMGLPAKRVMMSPVQAYVPEAELAAKEKEIRRLLVEIASLATRRGELDQEIAELRALAECVARYSEDAQMKLEAEKAIARTNALRDRASSGPLAPDPNAPRAEDIVLLHPLSQDLSPREQLRIAIRGNWTSSSGATSASAPRAARVGNALGTSRWCGCSREKRRARSGGASASAERGHDHRPLLGHRRRGRERVSRRRPVAQHGKTRRRRRR